MLPPKYATVADYCSVSVISMFCVSIIFEICSFTLKDYKLITGKNCHNYNRKNNKTESSSSK